MVTKPYNPLCAAAVANCGAIFPVNQPYYSSGLTAGEIRHSRTWYGARNSLRDLNNPMPINGDEPFRYTTLLRNSIKLPLH